MQEEGYTHSILRQTFDDDLDIRFCISVAHSKHTFFHIRDDIASSIEDERDAEASCDELVSLTSPFHQRSSERICQQEWTWASGFRNVLSEQHSLAF